MFEAPKAAPKGTVIGVPEEMTAEAYPGIPEKPEMGSARRTLPSGPVPVVEDKPDRVTAFGLTAPVAKMMRENGMSEADAKQVAENMVELYKQSNNPNLRAWLEDVAEKQTASKMTEAEKWSNAALISALMTGATFGTVGLIEGAGLVGAGLAGALSGSMGGIPVAMKADSVRLDERYEARKKARAEAEAKARK